MTATQAATRASAAKAAMVRQVVRYDVSIVVRGKLWGWLSRADSPMDVHSARAGSWYADLTTDMRQVFISHLTGRGPYFTLRMRLGYVQLRTAYWELTAYTRPFASRTRVKLHRYDDHAAL